jgi:hypothetical protein
MLAPSRGVMQYPPITGRADSPPTAAPTSETSPLGSVRPVPRLEDPTMQLTPATVLVIVAIGLGLATGMLAGNPW